MVSPLTEGKGKGQSALTHRLTVNFYTLKHDFPVLFPEAAKG
jgi:hypothetical protein